MLDNLTAAMNSLRTIDWDFADSRTDYLTHGLHPYPAKYIPQLPATLIQELSSPGETVADIFCGSGTTLVEALHLGRNAVGVDANPLACLISDAKTTRIDSDGLGLLNSVCRRSRRLGETVSLRGQGLFTEAEPFVSSGDRPGDEAISFWFEPFVVEEIAEILSWCRELPSEPARRVALVALSAIIVSVSRQDSDTRYVRRQKAVRPGDTLLRFARSLEHAVDATSEFTRESEPSVGRRIFDADVLDGPDIGKVDLVVCSPPYPNAYSYHLYHMTRMLWLGMNSKEFKAKEIGSHRKYSRKGPNGATVETFKAEMSSIFGWLSKHLSEGLYACFVVGDSTIRGERLDNGALLSEVAADHGFLTVGKFSRMMRNTKKAFNPAIGKIKNEYILVFKNDAGGGT